MTEPIEYTNRYVADADKRRRFARAYVGYAHRPRGVWVFHAGVLMLFAMILGSGIDPRYGLGTRVAWGLVWATIPTSVIALCLAALVYLRALRDAKVRLYDGAVIESGFGEREMVSRSPRSSSRLNYQAIGSVTPRGDFVFLRLHGVALVSVYPRELFPDDAMERIRQSGR
ncbi:MAG: hypothetical protein M3R09_00530 [Actinomycetota bacterium]|nr:hypothetical protein [Actinomycetota bacterium]